VASAATTPASTPRSRGQRAAFQTRSVVAANNLLSSIEELPRALSVLLHDVSVLGTLDLSFNRIAHLPAAMSSLGSLEVLRLHSNRLADIDELGHLTGLRVLSHLSLQHNPLSALSEMHQPKIGSDAQRQAQQAAQHAAPTSRVVTYPLVRWPAQSMSECLGQSNERIGLQRGAYRLRVLCRVPQLRQLDFAPITSHERTRAAAVLKAEERRKMMKAIRAQSR